MEQKTRELGFVLYNALGGYKVVYHMNGAVVTLGYVIVNGKEKSISFSSNIEENLSISEMTQITKFMRQIKEVDPKLANTPAPQEEDK